MDNETRKISTKIWRPVVDKLTRKLDKACLRRDAFLEKVLEVEIPYLDAEVAIPNSESAQQFIVERLDFLDRKLVSLALPATLIDQLADVCKRKRIVRDAFFNRVFLLLAASPKTIDRIFFPGDAETWRQEVWRELKHDGPFFQNVFYPLQQEVDPFWPIRTGLELYGEEDDLVEHQVPGIEQPIKVKKDLKDRLSLPERVYTVTLTNKTFSDADLYGLNCYLADWEIPGHPAEIQYQKELDEILDSF